MTFTDTPYPMSTKLKILVVDDHAIVREGLVSILKFQKDLTVVGEAADGAEAIRKTLQIFPFPHLCVQIIPLSGAPAVRMYW